MIESIHVIGARGRVGGAVSERLAERGVRLDAPAPELVLLCVPDRAIAEVAETVAVGPWVAPRQRRDRPRRARAAHAPLLAPSAPVVHEGARRRAAGRRLGRGHG